MPEWIFDHLIKGRMGMFVLSLTLVDMSGKNFFWQHLIAK